MSICQCRARCDQCQNGCTEVNSRRRRYQREFELNSSFEAAHVIRAVRETVTRLGSRFYAVDSVMECAFEEEAKRFLGHTFSAPKRRVVLRFVPWNRSAWGLETGPGWTFDADARIYQGKDATWKHVPYDQLPSALTRRVLHFPLAELHYIR